MARRVARGRGHAPSLPRTQQQQQRQRQQKAGRLRSCAAVTKTEHWTSLIWTVSCGQQQCSKITNHTNHHVVHHTTRVYMVGTSNRHALLLTLVTDTDFKSEVSQKMTQRMMRTNEPAWAGCSRARCAGAHASRNMAAQLSSARLHAWRPPNGQQAGPLWAPPPTKRVRKERQRDDRETAETSDQRKRAQGGNRARQSHRTHKHIRLKSLWQRLCNCCRTPLQVTPQHKPRNSDIMSV